jgi:hypothetical protein
MTVSRGARAFVVSRGAGALTVSRVAGVVTVSRGICAPALMAGIANAEANAHNAIKRCMKRTRVRGAVSEGSQALRSPVYFTP